MTFFPSIPASPLAVSFPLSLLGIFFPFRLLFSSKTSGACTALPAPRQDLSTPDPTSPKRASLVPAAGHGGCGTAATQRDVTGRFQQRSCGVKQAPFFKYLGSVCKYLQFETGEPRLTAPLVPPHLQLSAGAAVLCAAGRGGSGAREQQNRACLAPERVIKAKNCYLRVCAREMTQLAGKDWVVNM